MTQTTETPRVNHYGDPCPGWCNQEHDTEVLPERNGKPAIYASSHAHNTMPGTYFLTSAHAVQHDSGQAPIVFVHAVRNSGYAELSPDAARVLAGILDVIADHPEEAAKLAVLLRESAEIITPK